MKKLTFELEFITPAFIGGASHQPELRPASFVGLLRWWWRIVLSSFLKRSEEIFSYEGMLLGSQEQVSRLVLRVREGSSRLQTQKLNEMHYMLGLGGRNRECIPAGYSFYLDVIYREVSEGFVRSLIELALGFGGIGYRSRKGFGNMQIKEQPLNLELLKREHWESILKNEKPFRGIADGSAGMGSELPNLNNLIVLKYRKSSGNWKESMEELGRLYREVRLKDQKTFEYMTGVYRYLKEGRIELQSFEVKNHVFGLPIMFRSKSMAVKLNNKTIAPQAQISWIPEKEEKEEKEREDGDRRRASPFIFLIKRDGIYVLGFRCRFLPEGSRITIQPKGGYWKERRLQKPGRLMIPLSVEMYMQDFDDAVKRLKESGFVEVKL